MKNQSLKGLAAIALAGGLTTTSCDLLKDVDYTVTPDPLEMHGDSVRIKVEGVLPEKGLNKKASVEITPSVGGVALKTITIQGEKAEGNGQTIMFKPGGKFTYTDVVAYKPSMEESELSVSGVVYKKGKEKDQFGPEKIADATIITPYLVQNDQKVLIGADQFQRVTEEVAKAQINYLKNMSNVRPAEMKDEDIKAFEAFMAAAQTNPKIAPKTINILAYASPEGEEGRNNELSTARSESGKKATASIAKKAKNEFGQADESFNLQAKGEDWAGFKAELEKSEMQEDEKNLVLRVLSMYSDPAQREKEMRNMAKTFDYLEKNVLPQLRRSQINFVYDLTGYSDEELTALAKTNPDTLKVEELLFAATLTDDLNEKLRIYKEVERLYSEDWRGPNNVGYVLFLQGKTNEAKAKFEKANNMQENPQSLNNLGVIAHISGDRTKAKELYGQAMSAGAEVKYNMGIANIQDGKYEDAVSNMGDEKTFNKALAQVLAGNLDAASSTIDEADAKEEAMSYYLKAIIAARQNNENAVVNNLKSAFGKDASLKAKAAKDREFIKFFESSAFLATVK
ncbi:tetratricopeptide repeat protein [Wandonia haliotis]|uniref:Tetratricopeptide repeat protein n=1 Tax=Wandonia haliotis TaxID=574963 RepID=A0ABP3Y517_9FLAO